MIQNVYNFWNTRPCNIRHSDKDIDSLEFFDEVAKKRYNAEPHILNFLNLSNVKGKRILELGSGIGTDAIQFAKHGAHMVCVDLTPNSIERCKKNFDTHNLTGEFYVCNIEELDKTLPETLLDSFDIVYSFGVIHHTPNPEKVIPHIKKFLKSDGEFRFMVYSKFSYKLFWLMHINSQWTFDNADTLIQTYSEAQTGCPVTYTYTFDNIKELLSNNFKINSIWKDHIFKYDIESYKQNIFKNDIPFENVSEKYFNELKSELGWHTLCIANPSAALPLLDEPLEKANPL